MVASNVLLVLRTRNRTANEVATALPFSVSKLPSEACCFCKTLTPSLYQEASTFSPSSSPLSAMSLNVTLLVDSFSSLWRPRVIYLGSNQKRLGKVKSIVPSQHEAITSEKTLLRQLQLPKSIAFEWIGTRNIEHDIGRCQFQRTTKSDVKLVEIIHNVAAADGGLSREQARIVDKIRGWLDIQA